jgi:hypothetical protein
MAYGTCQNFSKGVKVRQKTSENRQRPVLELKPGYSVYETVLLKDLPLSFLLVYPNNAPKVHLYLTEDICTSITKKTAQSSVWK